MDDLWYSRELREFNATGNDLLGVPPGLLSLVVKKLDQLRLEHNPLLIPFPGEFVNGYHQHTDSPQTLRHIALRKLRTESRLRLTAKTNPFEVGRDGQNVNSSRGWNYWTNVYFLTQRFRSGSCCWCGRARFGQGISVCRHCVDISNYKQVPIMFNCCGPGCAHEAAQCSANEFETRFYADHSVAATELAKQ
ncbi:hypothetical protein FGIG_02581 [Fasciola gigantica]|uniref:Uncharacterized protein n=1 Tax=Fasciola gigantica TaxID=46835 RepID=A0A504YBD8_FASGI|nr:hypothetical protein FGIG_02581 [Fasciola gigantica]